MPLLVFHATRRSEASREALGNCSLDFCRATRLVDGARARFYWISADAVAVMVEADTYAPLNCIAGQSDDALVPELSRSRFALADVAELDQPEIWREPRQGQAAYEAAGR